MIGKPQWFKIRKYGGWGLTPATKEGWLYIFVFIIFAVLIQNLPLTESLKTAITITATVLVIIDVLDIMYHLKKDEREILHEAISERNASWAMVFATISIFGYKAISAALVGSNELDYFLLVPILVGTVAKGVTNLYLRNK